jgi:phage terminase large subunit-like protein
VIQDAILEMHERTPLHTVVLDPNAGGEQLAAWIEEHIGARVVAHSQDPAPMAKAAERFTEAIREGTMTHPADDTFTAHVLAAKAKTTSGEKWKLVKHRRPIDAAVAAAMVHSVVLDNDDFSGPLIEVFG